MTKQVEKSIVIDAPVAAVWAALADFPAIHRWAPNVTHSAATTETHTGIGATRRVQVGRIAVLEQIDSWEPLATLGYTLVGLPPMAGKVRNTWQLSDRGGKTETTLTSTIDPWPGPPGKIASGIVARTLAKADGQMLQGLAGYVTREQERS